jgi:hypothetical protein
MSESDLSELARRHALTEDAARPETVARRHAAGAAAQVRRHVVSAPV